MPKVGLFFGSFDPPHIGHVDLVTSALNAKVVDQVMVIPAWQNVWKPNSSPYTIRYDMCRATFKYTASVDNVEWALASQSGGKVHTYDVIKFIKSQYSPYGSYDFVMLTSSETFEEIPRWENGDLLLKEIPVIVEGVDFHGNDIPIHSTKIRDIISKGLLPQPFVSGEVYEIIKSAKLYI